MQFKVSNEILFFLPLQYLKLLDIVPQSERLAVLRDNTASSGFNVFLLLLIINKLNT